MSSSSTQSMVASLSGAVGSPFSEVGIPGMTPKRTGQDPAKDFIVKYYKADLDDPEDLLMIEDLETKALDPNRTGIVLLESQRYMFQSSCFIVLKYLQKRDS